MLTFLYIFSTFAHHVPLLRNLYTFFLINCHWSCRGKICIFTYRARLSSGIALQSHSHDNLILIVVWVAWHLIMDNSIVTVQIIDRSIIMHWLFFHRDESLKSSHSYKNLSFSDCKRYTSQEFSVSVTYPSLIVPVFSDSLLLCHSA